MPERAEPTYPTPELSVEEINEVHQRRLSAAVYTGFRVLKLREPKMRGLHLIGDDEKANWVSSHRLDIDIPAAHLPIRRSPAHDQVIVPTKEEYWYQRVLGTPITVGRLMEHGGSVPVSGVRDDNPDKVVNDATNFRFYKRAVANLNAGHSALWFGEGHRFDIGDHEIHDIGKGVAQASRQSGVGVRTIGIAYKENPLDWRVDAAITVGEWIDPPTRRDDLEEFLVAVQGGVQMAYNSSLEMLEIEPTHFAQAA